MTTHVEFLRPVRLGDGNEVRAVRVGRCEYVLDRPWGRGGGVMVQPILPHGQWEPAWKTFVPYANIAFVSYDGEPL